MTIDEELESMADALLQEGSLTKQEIVPHVGITVNLDQLVHDPANANPADMSDVDDVF